MVKQFSESRYQTIKLYSSSFRRCTPNDNKKASDTSKQNHTNIDHMQCKQINFDLVNNYKIDSKNQIILKMR